MTHSPTVSEAGLNGLIDYAVATGKARDELEMWLWAANDILLQVYEALAALDDDDLFGAVHAYLIKCPRIDEGAHMRSFPPRPETGPSVEAQGEGAPTLGPPVDIEVPEGQNPFRYLKTTEDYDGGVDER